MAMSVMLLMLPLNVNEIVVSVSEAKRSPNKTNQKKIVDAPDKIIF